MISETEFRQEKSFARFFADTEPDPFDVARPRKRYREAFELRNSSTTHVRVSWVGWTDLSCEMHFHALLKLLLRTSLQCLDSAKRSVDEVQIRDFVRHIGIEAEPQVPDESFYALEIGRR